MVACACFTNIGQQSPFSKERIELEIQIQGYTKLPKFDNARVSYNHCVMFKIPLLRVGALNSKRTEIQSISYDYYAKDDK